MFIQQQSVATVKQQQQQQQQQRSIPNEGGATVQRVVVRHLRYMLILIGIILSSIYWTYQSTIRLLPVPSSSSSYNIYYTISSSNENCDDKPPSSSSLLVRRTMKDATADATSEVPILSTASTTSNTTTSHSPIETTTRTSLPSHSQIYDTTTMQRKDPLVMEEVSTTASTPNDIIEVGILSQQNVQYFRNIQNEIDLEYDLEERCMRYNYTYDPTTSQQPKRRIFYGALIADETMELLHIVASETYKVYTGMVLVESNRTQSFVPRSWKHHANKIDKEQEEKPHPRQQMIASLFGISDVTNVLIVPYVNEDVRLQSLYREHKQRDEIIAGWKQLGMQPNDIGLLADIDETFTRDYLRALQTCDDIPQLEYHKHYCQHDNVKITSSTRVYESSPECITAHRLWYHPDIIVGHCIDGIGNDTVHPKAPRDGGVHSFLRAKGFGSSQYDWYNESQITDNSYPLWNAADFRRTSSGPQVRVVHRTTRNSMLRNNHTDDETSRISKPTTSRSSSIGIHTGYHFHNFFVDFNTTRFKYFSYGHPVKSADSIPIQNISNDMNMMYRCVMNQSVTNNNEENWKWKHVIGGHDAANLFVPIYFMDANYRRRRHEHVYNMILDDERYMMQMSHRDSSNTTFI